ncbi:MAG: extracellular solute-binding protein [Candidatus Binatus sp.]|uniref:extracellular solute-binding protein n=1 Tax=Candidatus Binatus sp. TaxID=2811406 RepID=UPI002723C48A|nr:extracellular solute-binding protein [Candidatus Binatus sp.]MDO8434026.1 extracellular solute-binding protein [Candidatus Binatus sp.]
MKALAGSSARARCRAILCILATLAAGCGGPESTSTRLNIALAVFPAEAARYRSFVADFESRHRVRINIIAQGYGDILQAMRVQAGARGNLDLVELDLAMLAEAHNYAQPIDDQVSAPERALFTNAAWAAAQSGGHLYFVPHRLMWQAMIYNRQKVPTPPSTWDELAQFARNNPGKLAIKAARYEGAVCDALAFVWSAGGDECHPESPASLRAFDFFKSIAPNLNNESAVFREMSVLEAQARGSVWIHFNWPFAIDYLHDKGLAPEVDLSAPIPAGPAGRATPLGGGYLAIPRFAPHTKLASEFIQYLLTSEAQARLSEKMGWYGSVPPAPGSEDARLYAGYSAMRPYVRARPAIECYADLSDDWRRAIRAVLVDDRTAAQAVGDAFGNRRGGSRCDCAEMR